jgi:hypothetical protein
MLVLEIKVSHQLAVIHIVDNYLMFETDQKHILPHLWGDGKDRLDRVGLLVFDVLDQPIKSAVLSINDLSRRDR